MVVFELPVSASAMARLRVRRLLIAAPLLVLVIVIAAYFHLAGSYRYTSAVHEATYEVLPQKRLPLKLDAETEEEKDEERKGFDNNGFNQFVSDRLPLDREIPDTRDPKWVTHCVRQCDSPVFTCSLL